MISNNENDNPLTISLTKSVYFFLDLGDHVATEKKTITEWQREWFCQVLVWLKKVVSIAISSTTRPETEVGPRPIKAGLGDQESGVSGGRRSSPKHITPFIKMGTIGRVRSCRIQ